MKNTNQSLPAILLVGVLFCSGFSIGGNTDKAVGGKPLTNVTVHRANITHPGYNNGKPMSRSLMQVRDKRGHLLEYHMDVDSVACGDGVCEIITVRIYWDVLGYFKRYQLPAGGELTKKDHDVFSAADHKKLHAILSDSASSLQYVTMDQVTAPDQAIQETDAITGATPLAQQDSVVPGAVYTSFTLWHWTHGTAPKIIHTLTEKACSNEQLILYLDSGLENYQIFAIKMMTQRRLHEQAIQENVVRQTEQGSVVLVEPAIVYFKSMATDTEADVYYRAIERLFASGSEQKRIRYLDSLAATIQTPPAGYFDRLSGRLSELETYYEVHRLLNLLEARHPSSTEVTRQVLHLLDQPQFFIARRAYYYLKDQALGEDQRKRVENFRLKFQDRL